MKRQIFAVATSAVALIACGDVVTNTVNDGVTDWTLPESYSNNRVPLANDVVEIPDGYTVTVNSAESLAVVSRLWQVRPMGENSTIIFDFASGDVTNNSAITYGDSSYLGKIIKRGQGKVVFTAHNRFGNTPSGADYLNEGSYRTASVKVEDGWLILPQMVTKHQFLYGSVIVENDAVLALPSYDKDNPGKVNSCYCSFVELGGEGVVTNMSNVVSMQLRPNSGDFHGKISGKVTLYVTGRINLHGVENTISGDVKPVANSTGLPGDTGTIGLASFGMRNAKSSIGSQNYQYVAPSGGGFVYLGDGEVTDKNLGIDAQKATGGMFIDGGQHGNVQFTGKFTVYNENGSNCQTLYLYGTNDIDECVMNCQISTNLYICKRGPGTWRFADFVSNSQFGDFMWSDSLAVEEGTLKFDSLSESGVRCSLGYGTRKRLPYCGAYDPSKDVPYSIRLGGSPTANATLQYNGTEQNTASTRPIAVTGVGTLKGHGSPGGILGIANVWAADSDGGTLILDGETGTTNYIANIADSNGVLNVVKKGGGFWRISGDIDITGNIRAEGGMLEIENIPESASYNWYRVTIRELNTYAMSGTVEKNLFQLQEFAFYDVYGNRQFLNPLCHKPTAEDVVADKVYKNRSDYLRLESGMCGRANLANGRYPDIVNRTLEQIFNDSAPSGDRDDWSFVQEATCGNGTTALPINRYNPESFYRFVVHMTNGTPPIVSYDMARHRSNVPVCWTIEASTDGLVWDEVAKVDDYACPASIDGKVQGYWISNGKTFAKGEVRPYSSGCGFSLSASHNSRQGMNSAKIRSIGASAGATIRFTGSPVVVKGITADVTAESGGVIENAVYAADGTLYIDADMPQGITTISAKLRLADVATRGNVAGWSVVANGKQKGYRVTISTSGDISVSRPGLVITVK